MPEAKAGSSVTSGRLARVFDLQMLVVWAGSARNVPRAAGADDSGARSPVARSLSSAGRVAMLMGG